MLTKLLLGLLFLLSVFSGHSQELGKPFIKNYNRQHYGASLSNWQLVQDTRGVIHVANYDGLLNFDGKFWDFTPFVDHAFIFSVHCDFIGRVFVGAKENFGYLTINSHGQNSFNSLKHEMKIDYNLGSVFDITSKDDSVYFRASGAVVRIVGNKLKVWPTESYELQRIARVGQDIYSANGKTGLVKFTGDSIIQLLSGFQNGGTRYYDQFNKKLLIGSFNNGLYEVSKDNISELAGSVNEYLKENSLFRGARSEISNGYVFGTLKGGIVCADSNLNILSFIRKEHGLQNNTIKGLTFDSHNNLWVGMQEGISHIELNSPWTYWDSELGLNGIPWAISRHENKIFVGTTSGLSYLSNGKLIDIQEVDSKVWSLVSIINEAHNYERLFIGADDGLYEYENGNTEKIANFSFVSKLYHSKVSKSIIVGHRNGITAIDYSDDSYSFKEIKELNNNTVVQIVEDINGSIWVSSKFKGVYSITGLISDSLNVKLYNKQQGLSDVNEISLIEKNNKLFFGTSKGFYDLVKDSFEITDLVVSETSSSISLTNKDNNGNYFASLTSIDNEKKIVQLISVENEEGFVLEDIPFRRLPEMEFEFIYPEENGVLWIGGSEGLFRYDPSVKKDYTLPFNTLVRRAITNDSIIFYGNYAEPVEGSEIPRIVLDQPKSYIPKLPFENNNITFQYSATSYEASERNEFSHYLQNNEKTWSTWSTETKKEYNNLEPGRYIFHVKSKNIYDTIGRTASYEFVILPPWYMTTWAYSLFTILIALSVWLIAMAYSFRVRIHRKRLKLLVADRTYEVISQKKEIEKQRDELENKNREITTQHSAIHEKNKQLERSKTEIMTMNESLKGLNSSLEKEVEKRTSRIKTTMKKLQQTNAELDTFIYRASHDLKGPISRISGLTSLAKLEAPDDVYAKYFHLIEHTTLEMQSLLAKLTQVHEVLNKRVVKENVDIPSLLHEVRESVKYLNEGEKTTYSFDLDPDITIKSDLYLLRLIMQNILENALIFRKSDHYTHHIHIETRKKDRLYIIKVNDTGIGITEDQYSEIYAMFYRGSDKSKGNGLGLYLVKTSIDKMRGTIKISSDVGRYTEFEISIPIG